MSGGDCCYENEDSLRQASLSQEKLTALLATIKAEKKVMLLDTCRAGAFPIGLVK